MLQIQQLISDHINTWITAELDKKSGRGRSSASSLKVYGVQKLRELILDLAISGKLIVEKDTNNLEINFLKNIEKEMNELTKKGLLAKRKPLIPISEDEKFFKLPQSWEWIRLGKTGKIFNGNSINENEKRTKYTNIKNGRPFIATKDVGYGREKLNYKNGVLIPYDESKFKIAHKNAVLICSEGGSAGKKIGITEHDIFFGNKLFANETFSGINPRYIFYVYQSQSFYKSFFKRMTGIIGGIPVKEFLNIPIPIPPTKLQNEIVRKIDELMMLCDQLEQKHINSREAHVKLVKVLLNTLTQAKDAKEFKNSWQYIAKHFETLFTSEESLDELKQTILKVAVMGKLVSQNPNDESACELIRKIQFQKAKLSKKINVKSKKSLSLTIDDNKPFELPKGWVWAYLGELVTFEYGYNLPKPKRTNTGEYPVYGSNGVVGTHSQPFVNSKCIVIGRKGSAGALNLSLSSSCCVTDVAYYCIPPPELDLIFTFNLFHTLNLDELGKGIKPGLNRNDAYKLILGLPPLAEQNRIVSKVHEFMTLCDELKSRIQEARVKKKKISDVLVSRVLD